jgi:glutamate:GABA antiporter
MSESKPHLKRVLGRFDLILLFVVAITNLNVVPTVAAQGAATLWLWLGALVLFFWPQGIAVIELSARHPGEGGVYLWAKKGFGDFHGFLAGWCYWTNNVFYVPTVLFYLVGVSAFIGGASTRALADNWVFTLVFSVVLLGALFALNVRGLGVGKWVNNLGGIGTFIACFVLIGLGLHAWLVRGRTIPLSDLALSRFDWPMISSFGVICFALVGLELASVMGDEIEEPKRVLPGAVAWGGVISGLLYVGATLSVLLAVKRDEIGVVQGVMQAVERMSQDAGVPWILGPLAVVLAVSIAGIASAWYAGSARIPFVAGLDNYLPKALGRLHPRFGTPYVALAVHAVASGIIIAMSFARAGVHEAFVTLLDLAVVLQLVPFLYVYTMLIHMGLPSAQTPLHYSKATLTLAGVSGLLTTALGMVVAFVPSRQIESVWIFEAKMLTGCLIFLGLPFLLFNRSKRA